MRSKLRLPSLAVLLVALLVSCGGSGSGSPETGGEDRPFPELEEAARGTTVNFFMYGGDNATNAYVDGWISPRLKEEYDITLKRTPVGDTAEVVNKLLNEKQAGDSEGTVDLVWINGENFYTGSQAKLWFGPWAEDLPNAKYVDWESEEINTDFGVPVDGFEAPWSQAQFVMVYDSAKVENPPKSMEELRTFTEENPGRFSYPAPPDFTGNAFVEQAFYDVTGQVEPYGEELDEVVFGDEAPKLHGFMNGMEPNLWRGGETYPETSTALDELYANSEIDLTMSYNPYSAERQVEKGIFPEATRTYLLKGGTLSNTNYVAIPFNGLNKDGAEVVANFLQSPEAQLEMQRTHVVGGLTTLDLDRLPEDERREFTATEGETTIPLRELQANRVPEARTDWLLEIQDSWVENVLKR